MPSEWVGLPKSIDDIDYFKATELKLFFLNFSYIFSNNCWLNSTILKCAENRITLNNISYY